MLSSFVLIYVHRLSSLCVAGWSAAGDHCRLARARQRARHARGTIPRTHRALAKKSAQQKRTAFPAAVCVMALWLYVCMYVCMGDHTAGAPFVKAAENDAGHGWPPPLLCVVRFVSLYHRPPPGATVFKKFPRRTCAVSGQRRAEKNFPAAAIFFSLKVVIVCRAAKMVGKTFCNLMQERRMSWTQIFSQFEK